MYSQPQFYRIRVHRKEREVLHDRRYPAFLDLTPGPALHVAGAQLDVLLQALAYADGAAGERVREYRLTVEPWPSGAVLMDWAATTWPNPD